MDRVSSGTVDAFLDTLASSAPAPGGGAAAALCGALAAGLVAMVSRVTAERDPTAGGDVIPLTARADQLRRRLAELVDEDMAAYRAVITSRASGPAALEAALKRAVDPPLEIARMGREVLGLCETLAPRARRSTVSDLGVAAWLAWSALESGALTARVNLKGTTDTAFAATAAREVQELTHEGAESRHRASTIVTTRLERD